MSARVWCLTPNPVLESKFLRGRTVLSAGGKSHNVARQLNRWGVPAISLVPKGGVDWLSAARKDGAEIRFLPVTAPARSGYAILAGPGQRLDFFTPDPAWSAKDWKKTFQFLHNKLRAGDWLVVAGSSATGWPKGWWKRLIGDLQKRGVSVLVDSRGPVLREALTAGVDWGKANLAEAEGTMNRRGVHGCLAGMRTLSRGRCGLLITRGSRGLVMQAEKKQITGWAPKIQVRDATGSGDVVTAALVYGLRQKWPMNQIPGWAARMAAANAGRDDAGRVPFRG